MSVGSSARIASIFARTSACASIVFDVELELDEDVERPSCEVDSIASPLRSG